jgi:uncharacterized protein YceH (UPF0502 family)
VWAERVIRLEAEIAALSQRGDQIAAEEARQLEGMAEAMERHRQRHALLEQRVEDLREDVARLKARLDTLEPRILS